MLLSNLSLGNAAFFRWWGVGKDNQDSLDQVCKKKKKIDALENRACEQTLTDSYLHRTVNCLSKVQSGSHG